MEQTNNKILMDALKWWNELPMVNLRSYRDGWSNLVGIYYPWKTDCQDVTHDEIIHMYKNECRIELRKYKIEKIKDAI